MLRIGSRKSKLALFQAQLVVSEINKYFPDIECIIVPIITSGDKILDKNLYDIGGKALFLKELEEALLEGSIDIAVHSLKDVPGRLTLDLEITAVLERCNPLEVLVSKGFKTISDLPLNAKIGTCSVRRKIILEHLRPDLEIVTFRGNVDSRYNKVLLGEVDATILAYAGLERLNLFNTNYCSIISPLEMLPAPGQGVIAIEMKTNNEFCQNICAKINHYPTWNLVRVERAFVGYLDANCRTPLAAYAYADGEKFKAEFMLADIEGKNIYYHNEYGSYDQVEEIGISAAKKLLSNFP